MDKTCSEKYYVKEVEVYMQLLMIGIGKVIRWIVLEFFVLIVGNLNKASISTMYNEELCTRHWIINPQWVTLLLNSFTMFGVYFIYTYLIRNWAMTPESYFLIIILSFIHALLFFWDKER